MKKEFPKYSQLTPYQKQICKHMGGYRQVKKMILAEKKWQEEWMFEMFKNAFTLSYIKCNK